MGGHANPKTQREKSGGVRGGGGGGRRGVGSVGGVSWRGHGDSERERER